MRMKFLIPLVTALTALGASGVAAAAPAGPLDVIPLNPRTTFAVVSLIPGVSTGTPNSSEPRPALSIIKLYIVDYVLRHGDGSAQDRQLAQRAIQFSDNDAASALDTKYPNAIDAVAAEDQLANTWRGSFWGTSYTSAQDTATFLVDKERTDPASPILGWMATASPIAADGTAQNWGTVHIPAMLGTKWGWSDDRTSLVASASFGPGFATAAFTNGDPDDENADLAAFSIK
ncbi:serine hydrolase [Antrihabitans cavernicola]|uniref:Serine hydrolase n=1 Tax=Antrihabitans cavernicola TaxID=2495913 RepID=A0A5A7S8C4_9NOCA|nr:serine hydrolase [Spelaeibacter cavernicola]KAA0022176.1 serine hydrolase [Spelaeibacter cavernicola]